MDTTPLFEHTPAAFAGDQLPVALMEKRNGQRLVQVGHAVYTLDGARDFVATVLAAIQVGESDG